MFQETRPTAPQEDFKAHVGIDTPTMLVVALLSQPDVTPSNALEDCIFNFSSRCFPSISGQVDATLSPRDFMARAVNEFKDIVMLDVEVQHHSAVLVNTAAT